MSTVITSVDAGSPAERAGIRAGEQLLMINHHEIVDVLDYRFFCYDPSVSLRLREADGTTRHLTIEKEEGEDLGLNFDTYLMDEPRPCSNHCLFCFVDQMPPNMRDTLYFKDDDARLSFLMGNYITLTNLTEREAQRIIDLRISPINVSVQATEPQLRRTLLGNKDADKSLEYMRAFGEAGIEMNGQIVLCKGVNDGAELERSISDMSKYLPHLRSVSVVPVGLSKYREGLYPLEPFTKEEAQQVLATIHKWQEKLFPEYGLHFIHASDEWYILAEEEIPDEDNYDGYLQLENGVGMIRLLLEEFEDSLRQLRKSGAMERWNHRKREISTVTGRIVAPYIERMARRMEEEFPGLCVHVHPIRNDFFGERITVTGLLTGQDIVAQLKGEHLGEELLLPINVLRSGERVLLDDYTVEDISSALQVPVNIVKSSGYDFTESLLGKF